MQDRISINGVAIKQPDEYTAALSTTSTSDSARDMNLIMRNTPIGTVQAYTLKWKNISLADAAVILQQVLNRGSYTAHYCDIYTGGWNDATFYTANVNSPVRTLKDGQECWKELSFQMTRINPI